MNLAFNLIIIWIGLFIQILPFLMLTLKRYQFDEFQKRLKLEATFFRSSKQYSYFNIFSKKSEKFSGSEISRKFQPFRGPKFGLLTELNSVLNEL